MVLFGSPKTVEDVRMHPNSQTRKHSNRFVPVRSNCHARDMELCNPKPSTAQSPVPSLHEPQSKLLQAEIEGGLKRGLL